MGRRSEKAEPWTEYARDYPGFCRDILGIEPWQDQVEIAEALYDHKSVAVASAHGCGKTFTLASIVLWWHYTRKPARVSSTAPTKRQVEELLWAEIRQMQANAKVRLPGRVLRTKIEIEDKWKGSGFTARNSTAAQGVHQENVLNVYDEATGVPDETKGAMDGALTGDDAREIVTGNPTGLKGWFRDAFHKDRKHWWTKNISAWDTPNVKAGKSVIRGLVDLEWVLRIKEKYGEDHPYYVTRVLGQFVSEMGEKVVPVPWVEAAQARWDSVEDGGPVIMGVDIARSGADKTAIVFCADGACTCWK